MNSVIKYYGGKGLISQDIIEMFPDGYEKLRYIEPFGGGASVLFQKRPSEFEIYNDINKNVYSLFKVLSDRDSFEKLREKLSLTYYSEYIRGIYKSLLKESDISELDRAYYYFYVNRTSVNGFGGFSINHSIRNGVSKSISDYLSTIDRLEELHTRLSRVIITNMDAIVQIKKYDDTDVIFYLDPPYHPSKRTSTRYPNDFSREQHEELVDVLLGLKKARFILSGYDCEEYSRLNDNFRRIDMVVNTTDGLKKPKKKVESFWLNYEKERGLF